MMHPTVVAQLAAAHQEELLRAAEHHRRIRRALPTRLPRRSVVGQTLRERFRQLAAPAPARPAAEPCCA